MFRLVVGGYTFVSTRDCGGTFSPILVRFLFESAELASYLLGGSAIVGIVGLEELLLALVVGTRAVREFPHLRPCYSGLLVTLSKQG